jgi:hypothetical protein
MFGRKRYKWEFDPGEAEEPKPGEFLRLIKHATENPLDPDLPRLIYAFLDTYAFSMVECLACTDIIARWDTLKAYEEVLKIECRFWPDTLTKIRLALWCPSGDMRLVRHYLTQGLLLNPTNRSEYVLEVEEVLRAREAENSS